MPRRPKVVVEPAPRTDAVVGRELQDAYRRMNEHMADRLSEGEAVQYFDDGWRYGHVEKLPESDESKYGEVRVVHAQTGRVWIDARDIKPLDMTWEDYFAWKRGGDDPPEEKPE